MEEKVYDILAKNAMFFQTQEESDGISAKRISSLFKAFHKWSSIYSFSCESDVGHFWYEIEGDETRKFTIDSLFQYWIDNIYNK